MLIVVDVDDVIVDLVPRWLDAYNKEFNDNLTPDKITTWAIDDFIKPEARERFKQIINNQRFYWDVGLIPGSLEGVKALRDMGHRLLFVTSAFVGHAGAKLRLLQTYGFLESGRLNDPDYLEVADKSLIEADLIIDDRQSNIIAFAKKEKCAIIFDKPWNQDLVSDEVCLFRAKTWEQVVETVKIIMSIEKPTEKPKSILLQTGVKFDDDKDRWDLLPWVATAQIVKVLTQGAKKYAPHNWAKGMSYSRVYAACLRHLTAWFNGEDNDTEWGLSHLAHAGCCVLFLLTFDCWKDKYEIFDDRPTRATIDALTK